MMSHEQTGVAGEQLLQQQGIERVGRHRTERLGEDWRENVVLRTVLKLCVSYDVRLM